MAYETVILKREGNIATLILNRPERLNALNEQVFAEMNAALDEVEEDESIQLLVLTGAGRAFSAGADLKRDAGRESVLDESRPEVIRNHLRKGPQAVARKLQNLSKPTIAMVNGAAAGAGFSLALACDMRTGCENTRFNVAFTRIGLVPGPGDPWFLPRIVGLGKAAELLFTGDFINAEDAARCGLLNRLVPAADLERETMVLARRIADGPPLSHRLNKLALYKGLDSDLDTILEFIAVGQAICIPSHDHKEGVAAFREKRQAVFKGY